MEHKSKVLFLCTGNSCRSQMAEGILKSMGGDRYEPVSAGMDPTGEVHPLAVKVMDEVGISISSASPKDIKTYLGRTTILYLVIVCDKANETCPRIWPGLDEHRRFYWPFDDPAEATGSEEEKLEVFRRVRDEIRDKIGEWLKNH